MDSKSQLLWVNHGQFVIAAIALVAIVAVIQFFKTRRTESTGFWTLDDGALESLAHHVKQHLQVTECIPRPGLIDHFSKLPLLTQVLTTTITPIATAITLIVTVSVVSCNAGNAMIARQRESLSLTESLKSTYPARNQ
ncbi:MAG: hypothetical protein ACKO38_18635 [Planctomycetota bacterium]